MPEPALTLQNDRYAVVGLLGEGGQAATFEAVDKRDGRLVVLKRFRVRGAQSWKEVELAEREARVLATLDHPRLPRYVEHFEEGGELFLVTEKIDGESLAERRKRGATLAEADVLRLLHDASEALDYLHGRAPPVIHRDIKPGNVIRRPDGSFSLIDFGSVRDRMRPEGGSTVVGTFGYMAPEQFQGRAMPASDVYAVGVTALVMLTGREPEDLPHRGLAIDVKEALRGTRVSAELGDALVAMVQPDPDRRATQLSPLLARLAAQAAAARAPSGRPTAGGPAAGGASHAAGQGYSHHDERRADRDERRAQHHREREARRELRRSRRGRRVSFGVPWPLVLVLTLGLTVAEVAVTLALRVAVPVVFTLLSLFLGRRWREAAARVAEGGRVAGQTLAHARDALHGRGDERGDEDPGPRIEVEPQRGVRVGAPSAGAGGEPGRARSRVPGEPSDAPEQELLAEDEARDATGRPAPLRRR